MIVAKLSTPATEWRPEFKEGDGPYYEPIVQRKNEMHIERRDGFRRGNYITETSRSRRGNQYN